jgi:hypothetical protein
MAKIECTQDEMTCEEKFNVTEFPTLLRYKHGVRIEEYLGPDTLKDYVRYVRFYMLKDDQKTNQTQKVSVKETTKQQMESSSQLIKEKTVFYFWSLWKILFFVLLLSLCWFRKTLKKIFLKGMSRLNKKRESF